MNHYSSRKFHAFALFSLGYCASAYAASYTLSSNNNNQNVSATIDITTGMTTYDQIFMDSEILFQVDNNDVTNGVSFGHIGTSSASNMQLGDGFTLNGTNSSYHLTYNATAPAQNTAYQINPFIILTNSTNFLTLTTRNGSSITLNGHVGGAGNITISNSDSSGGTGTVTFNNPTSAPFNGTITTNTNTTTVFKTGGQFAPSALAIGSGSTFELRSEGGVTSTLGYLSGIGTIALSNSGSSTSFVNITGSGASFGGSMVISPHIEATYSNTQNAFGPSSLSVDAGGKMTISGGTSITTTTVSGANSSIPTGLLVLQPVSGTTHLLSTLNGSGNISINGAGSVQVNNGSNYTGTITLTQGTLNLTNPSTTFNLSSAQGTNTNITPGSSTLQYWGSLGSSAGTISFSPYNNYATSIVINSAQSNFTGTLSMGTSTTLSRGVSGSLGTGTNIALNAGSILSLGSSNLSVASISGGTAGSSGVSTSQITASGSSTNLTVGPTSGTVTYSGTISGVNQLEMNGAGTWALANTTNSNSWTSTKVTSGTLALSGVNVHPSAASINIGSSGTLAVNANQIATGLTGSGTLAIGSNTQLTLNRSTNSFSGTVTGGTTSTIAITQGTSGAASNSLTLNGNISGMAGIFSVPQYTSLLIGGSSTATFASLGGSGSTHGEVILQGSGSSGPSITITDPSTFAGQFSIDNLSTLTLNKMPTSSSSITNNKTLNLSLTGTSNTYGGSISSGGDSSNLNITSGTITFNAAQGQYLGTVNISSGATVKSGVSSLFSASKTIEVSGTLDLQGNSTTLKSITGTETNGETILGFRDTSVTPNTTTNGSLTLNPTESSSYSGKITDPTGCASTVNINIASGVTYTLSGNNTYGGATTVTTSTSSPTTAGVLAIEGNSAIPSTTILNINSHGSVSLTNPNNLANYTVSTSGLTGDSSGTLSLSNNNFTVTSNQTATYAGALVGSSNSTFRLNGSGNLTLSGSLASMTGRLSVGDTATLTLKTLPASAATLRTESTGSTILFDTSANTITIPNTAGAGLITGSANGTVKQSGSNAFTIAKALTYAGPTVIAGNTVISNVNLSTSSITVTGNGSLTFQGNDASTPWTINTPLLINATSDNNASAAINAISGQQITINNPITLNGTTITTNGVTTLSKSATLSLSGNISIARTQLQAQTTTLTYGSLIIDPAADVKINNATLALSGANTLSGNIKFLNSAIISTIGLPFSPAASLSKLSSSTATTGIILSDTSTTSISLDPDLNLNLGISGIGSLNIGGAGLLRLSSTAEYTYTGTTTVAASGKLDVSSNFNPSAPVILGAHSSTAGLYLSPDSQSTLNNPSVFSFDIESTSYNRGSIFINSGYAQLTGNVSHGQAGSLNTAQGLTSILSGGKLIIGPSFTSGAPITLADATSELYISVPEGDQYILQNNISGGGRLYKVGAGDLILAGDFTRYNGQGFSILDGTINFQTNPSLNYAVTGAFSITTNPSELWILSADDYPIDFQGTITSVANSRFQLQSFVENNMMEIHAINLSGTIDIKVTDDPNLPNPNPSAVGLFTVDNLTINSGGTINFLFDQASEGLSIPMLSYNSLTRAQGVIGSYQLFPFNHSAAFAGREYKLMAVANASADDLEFLSSVAESLIAPGGFSFTTQLLNASGNSPQIGDTVVLSVLLTKTMSENFLSTILPNASAGLLQFFNTLQSIGLRSNNIAAQHTATIVESITTDSVQDVINGLLPSGTHQNARAISAGHGSSTGRSMLSHNNQASAKNTTLLGKFGPIKKIQTNTVRKNNILNKLSNKNMLENGGLTSPTLSDYLDGLQINGYSISAQTSYAHQHIVSDIENNPDSNASTWSGAVGVSKTVAQYYNVGLLGEYQSRNVQSLPNSMNKTSHTKEDIHTVAVFGLYEQPEAHPFYGYGYIGFSKHHYNTTRTWNQALYQNNTVTYDNYTATGNHNGYDTTVNIEAGYTHQVNEKLKLKPYLGFETIHLHELAYAESSYDTATLTANEYGNYNYSTTSIKNSQHIGIQGLQSVTYDKGSAEIALKFGYVREKNANRNAVSYFSYLYDLSEQIPVVQPNNTYHSLEANLEIDALYGENWALAASYTGKFNKYETNHTITLVAEYFL
ncbi:MAG: hypothetical protein FJ161_00205 [Gammaproteobacteria bacterium]|nr:hypothetical protein [Gammaproteobacteria bacterium]